MSRYPNLYEQCHARPGVHRSPLGYEHPWLAITHGDTTGYFSRREAREAYRERRLREASSCEERPALEESDDAE